MTIDGRFSEAESAQENSALRRNLTPHEGMSLQMQLSGGE
jgi:hypothetical protein